MARGRRRQLGGVDRLPSGRWRVRVTDPASLQRLSIGSFKTKAEAEAAFAKALAAQQQGGWVAPDKGRVTLEDYAWKWLATRLTSRGERLRPKTVELYEGFLRLHILPTLGSTHLSALTPTKIRAWHASLLDAGGTCAPKCYRLLRTLLATAIDDGLLVTNPCTIKGAGAEPEKERPLPTVDQVFALADAVEPRYRLLILLAAFGGLRRGELLGLSRQDLDLTSRTVHVRNQRQESRDGHHLVGPPKTDAGRRVLTLPTALIPHIEDHLSKWVSADPHGPVFVGERGAPLRVRTWAREWNRCRAQLGFDILHFHDLRHLAGTMAAQTGASTKELMRRLGHASPRAALRYQHATDERDEAIANGIDQLLAGRTPPEDGSSELQRVASNGAEPRPVPSRPAIVRSREGHAASNGTQEGGEGEAETTHDQPVRKWRRWDSNPRPPACKGRSAAAATRVRVEKQQVRA
jgi:integrase